jgi:hypothetical protein
MNYNNFSKDKKMSKKTPAYKDKHLQKRAMQLREQGWEVKHICSRLGFSQSTYYKMRKTLVQERLVIGL